MAAKILVNYPGSIGNDALAAKKQSVADQLGVCPEDVILLPGLSVSVVDLPDSLTKARDKADKAAQAEADRAERQQSADEVKAIAEAAEKAREEATEQHSADVRRETAGEPRPTATATPAGDEKNPRRDADQKAQAAEAKAPAAEDYDSWTLADLHAEAAKRDLHGRSGLDKAGLAKALQKADKDDQRKAADDKARAAAPAAGAHPHGAAHQPPNR